jgi:tetratricopeptide (TPR) repeat protein
VAIACFAALAVGAVAAVLLRRRLPLATFFFLWPLVTHAPTSLVPRDEVMVEYRTYLPMAGLCILLAWAVVTGLEALARRAVWPPRRRWTALGAAALVLLAALGAGTWERNEVWRTRVSLWDDVASKMDPATTKPWSLYRAWQNLGMSCVDATPPRADDALAALGKAIAIDPARWEAYNNRSLLRFRLKEYDAALSDAREAIALGATDPSPYFSAADALIGRGDPAGALEALREGMARHPGDAMPPLKLAWVLQFKLGRSEEAREAVELAAALQPLALGRPGETASELEAFLLRHPGNTDGLFTLGVCRLKWTREPERGAEALRRAIERSPGSPSHREALRLLAEAAWAAGREEDGLKLFQDLASRFPEDYEVQIRLGYYYLDWKKDRPKAEMHLRRAIELRPRHAGSSAARKKLEGR